MDIIDIKQKLRKLKRLETKIRYDKNSIEDQPLIWYRFFDLHANSNVKYPLEYLLKIDTDDYRKIADEYLAFVYSDLFEDMNIGTKLHFNKNLLIKLDLPFDADEPAIKKKFRVLAKQYHPDTGGDPEKFIELMTIYRKLIEN